MTHTPSPAMGSGSLLGLYEESSGNVKTDGTLSFPLQLGDPVANAPILHLSIDTDFKSRIVTTLDLGATNPIRDFATFPDYNSSPGLPLFIDPGWMEMLLSGDVFNQVAWGGKLAVKHMIIRCVLGSVAVHFGALDPFHTYPAMPPAKTRPFILQEGGVLTHALNGDRPFVVTLERTPPESPVAFIQNLPSIFLQTFESLNRLRIALFVERR